MKRRSGLGRGLDSLIPQNTTPTGSAPEGPLRVVSVDQIEANPRQPRTRFDEAALDELGASIASLGVLQPLLVRRTDAGYEIVAGERRWRAAQRAGLAEVPVMVVETDEQGSLERALVENIHRRDLNPIEEAAALKQLIDDGGLTQEQVGERVGRNRATISNSLRLLELPTDVQRYLVEGRLSAGHGKALMGLQGHPFLDRIARRAAEEGLSVRETEDLVRRYQEMTSTVRQRDPVIRAPQVTDSQQRLSDYLQSRVRVDMGKRKGKIVVEFSSVDELDRLTRVITGEVEGGSSSVASPDQ